MERLREEYPSVVLNAWEVKFRGAEPKYQPWVDPSLLVDGTVWETPVGDVRTMWKARRAMQTAVHYHSLWSRGALFNTETW